MKESLKFTCCFCDTSILPTKIDPMNINVIGKFDNTSLDPISQDFYSHFDCLKERLHKNVSGYFLKSSFVTDNEEN